MKSILLFAALAAFATPCLASTEGVTNTAVSAADVKPGKFIYSSDGKRIGRVYSVEQNRDGSKVVRVIFGSTLLSLPASTLTAAAKGFASTRTYAEITRR